MTELIKPSGHTPGFAFIDIQDKLSELLGRTVDLNTPQDLSRYFRDRVLAEAKVYYGQPQYGQPQYGQPR